MKKQVYFTFHLAKSSVKRNKMSMRYDIKEGEATSRIYTLVSKFLTLLKRSRLLICEISRIVNEFRLLKSKIVGIIFESKSLRWVWHPYLNVTPVFETDSWNTGSKLILKSIPRNSFMDNEKQLNNCSKVQMFNFSYRGPNNCSKVQMFSFSDRYP